MRKILISVVSEQKVVYNGNRCFLFCKLIMTLILRVIFVTYGCFMCSFQKALCVNSVEKSSEYQTISPFSLEIYSNCLKKFNSVEAGFVQTSGKQSIKGKLYLQKPGKLRIIYDENSTRQRREIMCDGEYLTEYVFDPQGELEESSSVDLSETPLQIVLNTQGIDLAYVRVVRVERVVSAKKNQEIYTYIYLVKKNESTSGKVVLVFKENKTTGPQFCGWIIRDEQHKEISLEPTNINNVIILPKTFSTSSAP